MPSRIVDELPGHEQAVQKSGTGINITGKYHPVVSLDNVVTWLRNPGRSGRLPVGVLILIIRNKSTVSHGVLSLHDYTVHRNPRIVLRSNLCIQSRSILTDICPKPAK